ncbi:MAG: HPr family phosphocarrier protein [Spirochaetota bacterium]
MKNTTVSVPWTEGLHMQPAAKLVRTARKFGSEITVKHGGKAADARSILSILMLCAVLGSPVEVQASGADEVEAIAAMEQVFVEDENEELKKKPKS